MWGFGNVWLTCWWLVVDIPDESVSPGHQRGGPDLCTCFARSGAFGMKDEISSADGVFSGSLL